MSSVATTFKTIAIQHGLHAAVKWLNSQVPYRYTAIFAFEGDMLRNICLVDKENVDVKGCADQPILNSYCTYIHRSGMGFTVDDANRDPRVADHPKRHSYQCYYGIPLVATDGKMLGTVCHFDVTPQSVTEDVAAALDDLASSITDAAFTEQ